MHTCIRTCTWIQAHKTRMHVCAQICMHVYMCVCTHVHTRVCTKYMNAYVCTHASGYTCVVNARSHVYMSIRVYTSSTQLTHPTPTDACLILHNAVCICNPFHCCGVLIGISTTVDGFDPWPEQAPQAAEQLSSWASTAEPVLRRDATALRSVCAATGEGRTQQRPGTARSKQMNKMI